MAFRGKVADTRTVLVHLLLCLVIFYSLYYMIGSVCFGAFRCDTFIFLSLRARVVIGLDHFDGLIPFDFKTEPTNLESNSKYLVNLLSMELTYFCSGLLFAAVVRRWVWDYALTVTLLHVLLTSLVMLEFPLVWQWWLALGSGLFLMICNGQLIAYFTCQSDQSYPTFNSY
ncbi:CF191 protein isoform X1 [Oncorhynchus mykiss]|uniref:CF191 protein isoform X1 n=2 Tax=Oncorhynchus mykiss TaxID=8022 RepID=UPI000B4ECC8B|nr:CF191 protein isoform X1 [Oncorhynchus mykiss]